MTVSQKPNGRKVAVVGVDGATFTLIKPWVAQGKLPNFARLMDEGVHAVLNSTMHPMSPPAWATFSTGLNPGKHGIFDFHSLQVGKPKRMASSAMVDGTRFWEILSNQGHQVGVINVLATYPPMPVQGFVISGFPVPPKGTYTYPPELMDEISRQVGDYQIDVRANVSGEIMNSHQDYIAGLREMVDLRAKTALYLLERYDPDCLVVVFIATDRVQNHYWAHADETDPRPTPEERRRFGNYVLSIYEQMDVFLGQLREALGEEGSIVVVSDHGFGPMFKDVNLNRWLADNGYLTVRDTAGVRANDLKGQAKDLLKKVMPHSARRMYRRAVPAQTPLMDMIFPVNWSQTRVYSVGRFGSLFVNLKGREPEGIVAPEEYDQVRSEVSESLRAWNNPETGQPLVKCVHRREDIYTGSHLEQAPDLLVEWADYGYFSFKQSDAREPLFSVPTGIRTDLGWSGNHHPEGILIMAGPAVKRGVTLPARNMVDIAPTILYAMGEPIPANMDGEVITSAFEDSYVATNPVHLTDEAQHTGTDHTYSADDVKTLEKRLADLGYL